MSSIYDWSLAAASNANADTDINWAEGQAPSTVNNSARFMMQRLREFLSDLGGTVSAGGSANVLTVTAESAVSSYIDGIRVSFRASVDNTSAATLNVNAVGAKPIVKFTLDGEQVLGGGEMQAGCIYEVVYSTSLNGAAGGWLLLNPTQQQIAAGLMMSNAMSTVPAGWLECDGSAISRTTYANLFTAIGTTWGGGNGSTTFNLPDTRGEFLRGWDHGRGVDSARAFASAQAEMIGPHTHPITDPGHLHGGVPQAAADNDRGSLSSSFSADTIGNTAPATTGITVNNNTGTENRPRNVAVMFVIKT